jgi:transposase
MRAVEVITSVERRRRWSRDEKLRIVAESSRPGRTASQVAPPPAVAVDEVLVREGALRTLVQVLHVRVGWR